MAVNPNSLMLFAAPSLYAYTGCPHPNGCQKLGDHWGEDLSDSHVAATAPPPNTLANWKGCVNLPGHQTDQRRVPSGVLKPSFSAFLANILNSVDVMGRRTD
jgi:hypothetical protein